jgi:hypothetical protein
MTEKISLPLVLLSNLLPTLEGVYVHEQAPTMRPFSPGPFRALIDTGASHSWVKPHIGDVLQPHSLEGYVVNRCDGTEENWSPDVKFGFMKGLTGKPVRGWVQLAAQLPAIDILLFSGEFPAPADLLIGMDLICSFIRCGLVFAGPRVHPTLLIEY